jgi:hypothetical protein
VHHFFYGADIHVSAVDSMLELLGKIARVPPAHQDDDFVTRLFLAGHEVDGMSEWQIRGGGVHVGAAGGSYRYSDAQDGTGSGIQLPGQSRRARRR